MWSFYLLQKFYSCFLESFIIFQYASQIVYIQLQTIHKSSLFEFANRQTMYELFYYKP